MNLSEEYAPVLGPKPYIALVPVKLIPELADLQGIAAREITHFSAIENRTLTPHGDFARYQIGREETEVIHVRIAWDRPETIATEVKFFRLLTYGSSWEQAAARYRVAYLREEVAP